MPQITIHNISGKCIRYETPARLLTILQDNQVDWMHACGGKGRCTTCKCKVLSGMESLTPRSPFEAQCLQKGLIHEHHRLACQCAARGDLVIEVPQENKLPHMDYSD